MSEQKINNLVWIDLEMTGLKINKDKILEVAVLITNTDLNILDEKGYIAFCGVDEKTVNGMDPFVKEMHKKNGVIKKCLLSKLTISEIDDQVVEYISKFVNIHESPICGNSISTDKMFIEKYMPKLFHYLHYRAIDVSTLKQLSRIWCNEEYLKENDRHEALGDVVESIEEMRYYKQKFFNKK